MKKLSIVMTLILAVAMANIAFAQSGVLWDQTDDYTTWSMGFFNMSAGMPPFGMTVYTVNDIAVPAGGWTVETISVYYDSFDPGWEGAVASARLYIEPKTGSLPTGDPATGTVVAATCVMLGNGFLEVTAAGLSEALAAGEYWIGLTPTTPTADNIHVSVAAEGDASPSYDVGGFPMPMWGNWAADLDGAMLITGLGEGVVDTEDSSWGSVKSLYR